MRYKEMTREEVIEALEYCASEQCDCSKCKLYVADDDACDCSRHLKLEAVELLKMQQNDDEGIYLILPASLPGNPKPLGYIKGEEKANEYCRKYNKNQKSKFSMIKAEELCNLEFLLRAHLIVDEREGGQK